jgi:hypothetical protein
MAENLNEYLKSHQARGFRKTPHYVAHGDFVTYYFRNDPCYAQRVDDLLTVFVTFGTKELVGCKIKGIKHILQTAGDFGIALADGNVRLGMFFFVGAALAKDEAQRSLYEQIGQHAKEATLDRKELETAFASIA